MDNRQQVSLDLYFFIHIHGRKPKSKQEFEEFQRKLDAREEKLKAEEFCFTEENFSETFTTTKGRQNPFIETQDDYEGWDNFEEQDWQEILELKDLKRENDYEL